MQVDSDLNPVSADCNLTAMYLPDSSHHDEASERLGNSIIHYAARCSMELFQLIGDRGVDLTTTNDAGMNLVELAILFSNAELAVWLMERFDNLYLDGGKVKRLEQMRNDPANEGLYGPRVDVEGAGWPKEFADAITMGLTKAMKRPSKAEEDLAHRTNGRSKGEIRAIRKEWKAAWSALDSQKLPEVNTNNYEMAHMRYGKFFDIDDECYRSPRLSK